VGNIHPADSRNEGRADIVTAVLSGLIMSDERAGDGIDAVTRNMRITAAPKHPGRDPVSVHIVEELVSVLRGEDGLAPRLAAVLDRLRTSATRLEASRRAYETTDQDTADTFGRALSARRR
jgi:hypothetical protein